MQELRFSAAGGEWRVAFAFDTRRKGILLIAGDKSGGSERRFYRELLRKADNRFDVHLARRRTSTVKSRLSSSGRASKASSNWAVCLLIILRLLCFR
jgi:hypothetical protein